MERQVRIFLDADDAEGLIQALDHGQGLKRLNGRFFHGDMERVRTQPEQLQAAELRPSEGWTHLIHPTFSREIVAHPVLEGPFAGWSRLDEVRSEVITLITPAADAQGLAPARLRANTHVWVGGDKIRKSAEFTQWVADAMRIVESYPVTQYDWIRIGPSAAAWARAGGRVHYLFRPVALDPAPGATEMYRPHALTKDR